MSRPIWFIASALASAFAGCVVAPPPAPPASAHEATTNNDAPAERDVELSSLLVDLITPQLCGRLIGSYIGLPGETAVVGAAAGAEPSVGRWWIRRCEARANDGVLQLSMGGMGWTFVDQESSGFRVRQYLRFDAEAQLNASMEVGYDSRKKIASLWMRPGNTVVAQVTPRGLVSANATGVLSSIAGGLLSLAGDSADNRARVLAQEQGSTQLRERLSAGFTLTFDVERQQLDFMVGALERGQTPERPYLNIEGQAWQVNQRSRVWPGGIDVVGPIDPAAGVQQLDVQIEDGEQAVIRSVCAADLERYLDASFQGVQSTAPQGREVARLSRVGSSSRVALEPGPCPSVLLLAAAEGSDLPIRLRYRVGAPTADPPAEAGTGVDGSEVTRGTSTPATPRQVRLQIAGVNVRGTNAAGHAWDLLGGEADVFVRVTSLGQGHEVLRTSTQEDRNDVVFDQWLPGAFRADSFPLRFSVYDKDVTVDELIGSAELPASTALQGGRELVLEIHTQDATPVRVGTLRLRVEAVP